MTIAGEVRKEHPRLVYEWGDRCHACSEPWPCAAIRLADSHDELLLAMGKIAEGAGPFSTDPLTHAANTIEAMKAAARAAIAKAEGETQ